MSALPVPTQRPHDARRPHATEAARQLYERHRQRIFAYCLSRLRDRQEAEDAVQNTFLYACSQLDRGVVPENELAWLFTIAHNVCRSRRRSLWRRGRIETATDPDTLAESAPAARPARHDELAGLSAALASLPDSQRQALLLREWQGLSYAEIADRLTLSQSAVETLLFRARRNLANRLAPAAEKVAVMLNLPVLLRLARRLGINGLNAKTATAAAMVAGLTVGAGVPLEHNLLHRPTAAASQPAAAQPHLPAAVSRLAGTNAVQPVRSVTAAGVPDLAADPAAPQPEAAATVAAPTPPSPPAGQSPPSPSAPSPSPPSASTHASAATEPAATTTATDPVESQVQNVLGLAGQLPVQLPALPPLPVQLPQLPTLPGLPQLPSLPELSSSSSSSTDATGSSSATPQPGTQPTQASASTSSQDSSSTGTLTLPSLPLLP